MPDTTCADVSRYEVRDVGSTWSGHWVKVFKKDGTFDGWKWVAEKKKE